MSQHKIVIKDGHVQFVYDDALVGLLKLGAATTTRVSHVEPHPAKGGWVADMTPAVEDYDDYSLRVTPVLIGTNGVFPGTHDGMDQVEPFQTRAEALAAEREYLTANCGL